MIPSKSIHKYRLNKGGYIENPQLFSLLSSCLLKIKPDPSIISLKPAKLLRFCLILQTIDYSLEDDPDFNYAVNLIEFQNFIRKKYPQKKSICNILAYQKNLEAELNPEKQKKIMILYEKDYENEEQNDEKVEKSSEFTINSTKNNENEEKKHDQNLEKSSKFLINPLELSQVLSEFCHSSLSFKDNKNPDDHIEMLQIQIHLSLANDILNWSFYMDEDLNDIGDITGYLKQPFLLKDPIYGRKKIEEWFPNPESLYNFYLMLGRRRKDDCDKAISCFSRAAILARGMFGELSREVIIAELELFSFDIEEESRARKLRRILEKMQAKFLLLMNENQENEENNDMKVLKKEEKKENIMKNTKEEQYIEEEIKVELSENGSYHNDNEENKADDNDDDADNYEGEVLDILDDNDENNDEIDEFILNPSLNLHHPSITPIDKILFAIMLLEQESITYRGYETAREILQNNPYNKEKLAYCYFKIAEVMLEIIDERTSYINFFGDRKLELYSLEGVHKYLMKSYEILEKAFGKYEFKVKDVVFELLKVNKRMGNFTEAYKYCVIAMHILKTYHLEEGGLIKSHVQRLKKEKYRRYQALIIALYNIERNVGLRKTIKRKEIMLELVMNFV